MKQTIDERTFDFALRILNLVRFLPNSVEGWVIGKQVLRAGTSIGANVEEAQAAESKDDFTHKMNIALKEARETHYWLRLIKASKMVKPDRLNDLVKEAEEIKKILGAIVRTSRRKTKTR